MTRYFGKVGYGATVDKGDGVWDVDITERSYQGDVIKPSRRYLADAKVNNNRIVGNAISIVADGYANNHLLDIRYVEWMGELWEINRIESEPPRLILWLGGVYNGPTPPPPGGP